MLGNRIGLDAMLPNLSDDRSRYEPHWTFVLMTNRRSMQFNGTIDFLPWDVHGHFLYIGVVRQFEHVYLLMVPQTAIGEVESDQAVPTHKHIRPMDARCSRAVFVMLAVMLANIHYSSMVVTDPYPSLDSDRQVSEYVANIL